MSDNNDPPDKSKAQPGKDEIKSENEQCPTPLGIHKCRENILKINYILKYFFFFFFIKICFFSKDKLSIKSDVSQ